jgi:hypothetical protein
MDPGGPSAWLQEAAVEPDEPLPLIRFNIINPHSCRLTKWSLQVLFQVFSPGTEARNFTFFFRLCAACPRLKHFIVFSTLVTF